MPAFAWHGAPDSNARDPWIDRAMAQLMEKGVVRKPSQALSEITNQRMASLTAEAAGWVLAQSSVLDEPGPSSGSSPLTPAAAQGLTSLMEEFRSELSAMAKGLGPLETSLFDRERMNEALELLQEKYLKRTGTQASGTSRGWFHTTDIPGTQPLFTDVMFMEMHFKSVPVPQNLFDLKLRIWRTIGLYYADPISTRFDFRWISLNNVNEVGTFTAGDFYRSYTPLTLFNPEVPVYTFYEPSSYLRRRKEAEEILFLDHGNDWRLRGFQAAVSWPGQDPKAVTRVDGQVMVGSLKSPSDLRFGDYFAGSRWSLGLLEDRLGVGGTGLLIWNDPGSANLPYIPNFSSTFPRVYRILGADGRFSLPLVEEFSLSGAGEWAGSQYHDDLNHPNRLFQDWAFLATGSAEGNFGETKIKATLKFLNIGPYFYSPGAQTNRFSSSAKNGYLSTNINKDDMLVGYLNKFSMQSVDRPAFAFYDRLSENILPYGDATPNRLGWIFDLSAKFGKDEWMVHQLKWIPGAYPFGFLRRFSVREIEANYVLNPQGTGAVAADSGLPSPSAPTRQFSGLEVATVMDLAKGLGLGTKTLKVGLDLKLQESDAGLAQPLRVDNFLAGLDFVVPVKGILESLTWSAAYVRTIASGSEYVVTSAGALPTSASYPFYMDTGALGTYSAMDFDVDRTTYSLGVQYSLSKTLHVRGDLFLNRFTRPSSAESDYWRISYEASF